MEIYNEVVHDLLSKDVKRQVELQKTATGFDMPSITAVGACALRAQDFGASLSYEQPGARPQSPTSVRARPAREVLNIALNP